MSNLREEFEKLREVAEYIKMYKASYVEESNYYFCDDDPTNEGSMFLNGALYAFQEQQKKIDEHSKKLKIFIDELKKTHNDDKDNKIDYWRGFSDCADSSVKVFLRDVGFIE